MLWTTREGSAVNRQLLQTVLRHAAVLAAGPDCAPTDADLVKRYAARGEEGEEAFAELVRRHGPMVWAVCRNLLADSSDAEDAFQATFLALVRSAGAIRSGAAVGGWLHGVAVRVAAKLRREAVRRRQREQRASTPEADRPVPDSTWDTLLAAVHDEVQRLPEPLRTAFVLCDLEGVPQPDAATRLGWKAGTLTGRLTRARQRLLDRLTRRGLVPTVAAGGLTVGAATASVPTRLMDNAMSLTAGTPSPVILNLVREAIPMTLNRTKLFAAAIVVAGGLAAGIGPVVMNIAGAQDPATGLSSDGQPPASGRASSAKGQPPRETSSGGMGLPPGGGVSAPKGGAGMGPPGAGMPGGGGFDRMMVARSQWEYKFVDLRNDHRDEFENAIRRNGNDGWEYCNSERLRRDNGATQIVLVFKRQAGGGMMGGGEGGFGGGRRGDGGSPGVGGMGGGGTRSGGGGGVGGGGGGGARIGGGPGLGGVPELKTFALKNVTANAAAKSLEETFDGPGRVSRIRVVAIPNSNQIIVFASPADLVTIEKLLANTIDVPSGGKGGAGSGGRSGGSSLGPPADSGGGSLLGGGTKAAESRINVFALKNADAVDLAAMLQKLFDHNAIITTDSRTNSLVVRANEDTLDLIRMLVTRLDTVERSNPTPPRKR